MYSQFYRFKKGTSLRSSPWSKWPCLMVYSLRVNMTIVVVKFRWLEEIVFTYLSLRICPTWSSNLKLALLCIYDVMCGLFSVGRMLIIQRCQSSQRTTKMTAKGAFLLTFAGSVASLPDRSTVQFKCLVFLILIMMITNFGLVPYSHAI